ncbi:MAG: beta-glucosidase H [Dehalococcoidia bacterium]
MSAAVETLLAALTIEEKVSLCAGIDTWHTPPIGRLGIPALKMTDGPSGARGVWFNGGPATVNAPCGIALGATWNPALVEEVGRVLGSQALTKGAQVLLGPTVNMHRHPLNGRHFECYSEDPHLASELAAAYVEGVQSQRVATAIKHFVANDQEFERMTISSDVDSRTLREVYLAPFEAAVVRSRSKSIMSAYNRLNGNYCAEHDWLLRAVLAHEWEFDGFIVSDWFGTQSTAASANAGLGVEMPGPPNWMGDKLLEAVTSGEVPNWVVDEKVIRLLTVMEWCGILEPGYERPPERALDLPQDREVMRRAAQEAIVLLKNDGILPLDPAKLRRVAVIGPNAATGRIQGGGSANVTPHYAVSPLDGLRGRLGPGVEVLFEHGCTIDRVPPPAGPLGVRSGGKAGFSVTFHRPGEADVLATQQVRELMLTWIGDVPGVGRGPVDIVAAGEFTCPESGDWTVSLSAGRLFVDGALVLDTVAPPANAYQGRTQVRLPVRFEAGRTYALRAKAYVPDARIATYRFGLQPPQHADAMERAVVAAAWADVAIVVAGTNSEFESEGVDRKSLDLPGDQAELIRRVAAANPRTVVVLNTGSPFDTSWDTGVAALVEMWFPGQECGRALADVLCGEADPGGRLPTTFPVRLEDTPAFANYPGVEGRVAYGEGVFIGHRWYEARGLPVKYPFGHGLSYAAFELGPLILERREAPLREPVRCSVDVRNTSGRAGSTVVQLYVHDSEASVARPPQELNAFAKVTLAAGETQRVAFELAPRAFAFWDDDQPGGWKCEPGAFELRIGLSSADIRARAGLVITGAAP